MSIPKSLGRGLTVGAQLALIVLFSIGLTTTTHDSVANTLSSSKMKVSVAPPSPEDCAAAEQTARLDKAMNALSEKDAALYRTLFAAQQHGDWGRADTLIAKISDKRLLGAVLADRLSRRPASEVELTDWLKAYASLPQAQDIYDRAIAAGIKNPHAPEAPELWSGGNDVDSAPNFTPELMVKSTAPDSANNKLAKAIQKTLHKGDPWAARNLLLDAQKDQKLTGTFAHDAEAVIAAAFFAVGERDQATALSNAAAGANQPLGLWIRGLIAWEQADYGTARTSFSRLAEHPALSDSNKPAANFWAYRAEAKVSGTKQARPYLEKAATSPRSFYGLLAAQALGRNPIAVMNKPNAIPEWNAGHRARLAAHQAGWRALALVQVGQNALAEAELRRLNPQGDNDKQQAMLALASYVPMPALALQVATLGNERSFADALYPVPPWKPQGGFQIDRALLFALARHESLFDPTAISSRGAQGLMQIMPATAKSIAAEGNRAFSAKTKRNLLDPDYNMSLGQKYVQHLASMPQIGSNLLLLLAAYNGGPAKVLNWASSRNGKDPLLFLETIPLRETRAYVARVMPHYWAYRAKLGKGNASLRQMAEGKWPTFSLNEEKNLRVAEATKVQ